MILVILPLLFSFTQLEQRYDYSFDLPKKVRKVKRKSKLDGLLKRLNESDLKINSILENNQKRVILMKSSNKLNALTRLKGVLVNSVLSTNHKASTVLVKLLDNEFFEDAELRCLGVNYSKRVVANCDLIVSESKSYQIDANLWDLDGSEGIRPDEYYTGEEKEFLSSSLSNLLEGFANGVKDTVLTPFGDVNRKSIRNQVLSGVSSIASGVKSKIKESDEKNLTVSLINSGREVTIFFNKEVIL